MLEMRLDGYGFPLALICMLNLVFWTFEALVVHAQNRKSKENLLADVVLHG